MGDGIQHAASERRMRRADDRRSREELMREHIMKRLWSADVSAAKPGVQAHMRQSIVIGLGLALIFACVPLAGLAQESSAAPKGAEQRSEERRVGKERRAGW